MVKLNCNHVICKQCLIDYVNANLSSSGLEMINARCPAVYNCKVKIPMSLIKAHTTEEQYKK